MKLTKKQMETINKTMRELNIDRDSRQLNCIKIHPAESKKHFDMKCEIAFSLYNNNKPFLTEAFANNRKQKFDIIDLLENEVIECVVKSNTRREKIPAKVTKIYGTERDN